MVDNPAEKIDSDLEVNAYSPDGIRQLQIGILGEPRLVRDSIGNLLMTHEAISSVRFSAGGEFSSQLGSEMASVDILCVILTNDCFGDIMRLKQAISDIQGVPPIMVLTEEITRGHIYAILGMGASVILDMECMREELWRAVNLASEGKIHLSPSVVELVATDMNIALEKDGSRRLPGGDLSRREVEIVQLLCEGMTSKQIARDLHLSIKTVENHKRNIYQKCSVDSVVRLMRHAIRNGIITL